MNSKDKKRISKFVASLQKSLKLQDWVVTINFKEVSCSGTYATMGHSSDSKHVELKVSKKFLKLPRSAQRQVLIHEMMHCHLFLLDDVMYSILDEILPSKQSVVTLKVLTTEIERATDALADVVSKMYNTKY